MATKTKEKDPETKPDPNTPPEGDNQNDPGQEAAAAAENSEGSKTGKRVRIILKKGCLGHLLLKEGDETEDPLYVALLKDRKQKLVIEIK